MSDPPPKHINEIDQLRSVSPTIEEAPSPLVCQGPLPGVSKASAQQLNGACELEPLSGSPASIEVGDAGEDLSQEEKREKIERDKTVYIEEIQEIQNDIIDIEVLIVSVESGGDLTQEQTDRLEGLGIEADSPKQAQSLAIEKLEENKEILISYEEKVQSFDEQIQDLDSTSEGAEGGGAEAGAIAQAWQEMSKEQAKTETIQKNIDKLPEAEQSAEGEGPSEQCPYDPSAEFDGLVATPEPHRYAMPEVEPACEEGYSYSQGAGECLTEEYGTDSISATSPRSGALSLPPQTTAGDDFAEGCIQGAFNTDNYSGMAQTGEVLCGFIPGSQVRDCLATAMHAQEGKAQPIDALNCIGLGKGRGQIDMMGGGKKTPLHLGKVPSIKRKNVKKNAIKNGMDPRSFPIEGTSNLKYSRGHVEKLKQELNGKSDPKDVHEIWRSFENQNGTPDVDRITIWVINGKNYITEGNHRWIAAKELGVKIPDEFIQVIDKGRWRRVDFNLFDNIIESK